MQTKRQYGGSLQRMVIPPESEPVADSTSDAVRSGVGAGWNLKQNAKH